MRLNPEAAYSIGNPLDASFEAQPRFHGSSTDVLFGPFASQYSEVTRPYDARPLLIRSPEVVAFTGYEIRVVRRNEAGVEIPVDSYQHYIHHMTITLSGERGGTRHILGDNNGNECKGTHSAVAPGFGMVIQRPRTAYFTAMLVNTRTPRPRMLPRRSAAAPGAHYSGLVEVPCSTRDRSVAETARTGWPNCTSQMAAQENDVCRAETYAGGAICAGTDTRVRSGTFLLDKDQPIPAPVDEIYVRARLYYQPFTGQRDTFRLSISSSKYFSWGYSTGLGEFQVPRCARDSVTGALPKGCDAHGVHTTEAVNRVAYLMSARDSYTPCVVATQVEDDPLRSPHSAHSTATMNASRAHHSATSKAAAGAHSLHMFVASPFGRRLFGGAPPRRVQTDLEMIEDCFPAEADSTVLLVRAGLHCHVGCLGGELLNADTGEVLCGVTARWGEGRAYLDEAGYTVELPPCLWGSTADGLRAPPRLSLGTRLRSVVRYSGNASHLGAMAQWQMRGAFERPPRCATATAATTAEKKPLFGHLFASAVAAHASTSNHGAAASTAARPAACPVGQPLQPATPRAAHERTAHEKSSTGTVEAAHSRHDAKSSPVVVAEGAGGGGGVPRGGEGGGEAAEAGHQVLKHQGSAYNPIELDLRNILPELSPAICRFRERFGGPSHHHHHAAAGAAPAAVPYVLYLVGDSTFRYQWEALCVALDATVTWGTPWTADGGVGYANLQHECTGHLGGRAVRVIALASVEYAPDALDVVWRRLQAPPSAVYFGAGLWQQWPWPMQLAPWFTWGSYLEWRAFEEDFKLTATRYGRLAPKVVVSNVHSQCEARFSGPWAMALRKPRAETVPWCEFYLKINETLLAEKRAARHVPPAPPAMADLRSTCEAGLRSRGASVLLNERLARAVAEWRRQSEHESEGGGAGPSPGVRRATLGFVDAFGITDGRCEANTPGDSTHFLRLLYAELTALFSQLAWPEAALEAASEAGPEAASAHGRSAAVCNVSFIVDGQTRVQSVPRAAFAG